MGLRRLHTAYAQLYNVPVIGRGVVCKGMAGLVGHHIHIPGGPIKVGQDEGLVIGHKAGAVAATPLVFPGVHIKGLCGQHKINELSRLPAHIMVHSFGCGKNRFLPPLGCWVPLGENQIIVIEHEGVHPQLFANLLPQPSNHGNHIPANIFPELLHLFRAIAQASHAVVAQLHKVLIAHFLGHPVPDMHQLVKDTVQLVTVSLQGLSQNLIGLLPGCPVGGLGILHQHGTG